MPSPKMQTLTPGDALVKIIRFICAHNTATALEYAVNMAPFLALTVKQRVQVHNAAVSLLAAGRKIELGSGANRRDPVQSDIDSMNQDAESMTLAAATAAKNDRNPQFVWAHGRYNPLAAPGKPRYKALSVAYTENVEAGKIKPAQDYVTAVKECVARDLLTQQGRTGGYIVAVKTDADTQAAANKAAKPSKQPSASSLEMLA